LLSGESAARAQALLYYRVLYNTPVYYVSGRAAQGKGRARRGGGVDSGGGVILGTREPLLSH